MVDQYVGVRLEEKPGRIIDLIDSPDGVLLSISIRRAAMQECVDNDSYCGHRGAR